MTGIHKNGVTNKAREAYRLICWIVIPIIIILAIFCFVTRKSSPSFKAPEINSTSIEPSGAIYIPTVFELQTALCEAGYTVEVDCVVGEETKRQWDSFCADRMAAKFITGETK